LLCLIGPPAVGKMTVGHVIAERTGLRLFHNHQTIELLLRYFAFGSPEFRRLTREFRRRIFEEVAASDLPGLVFTYVWAFDDPRDAEAVDQYARPFRERGGRVMFAELQASQSERLIRNETAFRLAEKPSKRDLVASRQRLMEDDARHQLESRGSLDHLAEYFHLDTSALTAEDAATRVIARFGLAPRLTASDG